MNLQEYIASGVLELYVLDRLDPAQRREVEANALQYPEVRTEIDGLERALEAYAQASATPPSSALLERLLQDIKTPPTTPGNQPPAPKAGGIFSWFPWLLALAACAFTFYMSTINGRTEQELTNSQEAFTTLEEDCDETQGLLRAAEERLQLLSDAATRNILLGGTENAQESNAFVFYNPDENRTFFRATNLPPPPAGKQYQLWAIDAAGPQDLGVLALDLEGEALLEVRFLPDVAAFAITLEDLGGKPGPDLSQLQVIGEV